MTKHKSEDYKLSAVKYYLKGEKTQEEICKIYECSVRSLMRWVDRYKVEKEIKRHNRKNISYKITRKQVQYIIDEVKKNKTITMDDLLYNLKLKYKKIDITQRHLSRIIRDNNITLKITRFRHEPVKRFGKDIDINNKIKEFYNEIKKYNINDIICIDETSINALMKRHHCYNEIGKRCVIKTHSQEVFKKYTGIFAISSSGVLGWELYDKGGIDTNRLYEFLEKYITTKYNNKLIILDNASSHRNERIRELINKNNKLLLSVPYQHFTNSIENYFSMFKSRLQKKEGLTHTELKVNISNIIKDIPITKYINIFQGAYNRSKKYVKKTLTRKRIPKLYKK